MPADIVSHPRRVMRLFELVRDPVHPQFHAALSGLRRAAFDPSVRAFHRQQIEARLAQIERIAVGAYVPPPAEDAPTGPEAA